MTDTAEPSGVGSGAGSPGADGPRGAGQRADERGRGAAAGGRLRRWGAWVRGLARDVFSHLAEQDVSFIAAGLTFYAAIAVVPLMLSAVYIAGLIVGGDTIMQLGAETVELAPDALNLQRSLAALQQVGPGLGIASFVAGLIPATTYGEGLLRAFTRFTPGRRPGRTSLRGRLLTSLLLALFPLFTIVGLFSVAYVRDLLGGGLAPRLLGGYLAFLFGWAATTVICMVMYGLFGPRRPGLAPLAWGSAAAGSFLSGMTLGWLAVLEIGINVGAAYGGSRDLGSVVLFLVYLYLVQLVLLVGYVLTLELDERRARQA